MPKRDVHLPEQLSAATQKFYDLLNEGQDSAVIVTGVAYLDACLASLLSKHFLESGIASMLLNPQSGAIGSFGPRASLAYVLALIDKPMFKDLQKLAELRNLVAHHHFALGFDSPEVSDICASLGYVRGLKDAGTALPLLGAEFLGNSRNQFVMSAVTIASRLLLTALSTKHVQPHG